MTLASKTKRYMLAMLACLCCLCTVLLLFPVSLLPASADANPQYMLKVDGSKGPNWASLVDTEIAGGDNATIPAGTYIFSFDYYTKEESKLEGAVFFIDSRKMVSKGLAAGRHRYFAEVELNSDVLGSFPMCHLGIDKGTSVDIGYMWNFKLELKDGDGKNYLKNPNFETGTLKGWRYGFQDCAADATTTADGMFSVVPFDESLVTEKYMLKVDGTLGSAWEALVCPVSIPEDGNYTFTFEYYRTADCTGNPLARSFYWDGSKMNYPIQGGLSEGRGTFSGTTAFTKGQSVEFGIDRQNLKTGAVYVWNLKLTKEGGSGNLLANSDFSGGNMAGWKESGKALGDTVTASGPFSVLEYDESLFGTPDDGKTYMLKMTNGRAGITYRLNVGTDIPEGTYVFAFDYFCDSNAAAVQADARFFGAGYSKAATKTLAPGRNTMTLEYTYNSGNVIAPGVLMPGVNGADGDPDIYMWNFKLTRKGDSDGKNYLSSFETGRFEGWRPGDQPAADASANGQFTVMEYDESLFVDSGDEDDGKTYMLKLDGSLGSAWEALVCPVSIPEDGNYTFSFDYFRAYDCAGNPLARSFYWDGSKMTYPIQGGLSEGRGAFSGTAAFTAGQSVEFGIDRQNLKTGVVYIWNLKLTKAGSSTNLLKNPRFSNGYMDGWKLGGKTPTGSVVSADPFAVLEYNEDLFVVPDDGKRYMLKIDGSSLETIWARLTQPITAPEDGTYVYTFNYYRTMDSTGVILARGFFGTEFPLQGNLANGKNSYRAEADFRKGDSFQIGFDRQNGSGTVYIWDLKLTKKDGDGRNLLKDPGFKNGKLTSWGAPGESVSGPFSVLEYDESLFTTIDPDDGKTYMIKLPGAGNVLKADDYVEETGNWIYFGQAFRVKMGDVYTFSYNYYTERTTTALARISPLTRMDQPVVQTLMAHYIEGKMVVTFRVGEQQGHGTYMGEMTEEQKQQAQYDAATDTVFLWFGITPGYYGDSYVWNLSLKKQGSDVNLFDNPNFQRGGGTMSGWFLNGTNPGAVKKKLNFEVSELDRSIWKDKIIEVPEQEDPRDPNVNFTLERDSSLYDADHTVDPNIQNGGNTNFDTPDGSDVHTGERTHTAACATVSAVCLVLATAAVLYPRLKRKKQR